MAGTEAYCVKCREKREIKDAQQVTMQNGRPATKGVCPVCGTAMFRIGAGSGASGGSGAGGGSSASGGSGASAGAGSGSKGSTRSSSKSK